MPHTGWDVCCGVVKLMRDVSNRSWDIPQHLPEGSNAQTLHAVCMKFKLFLQMGNPKALTIMRLCLSFKGLWHLPIQINSSVSVPLRASYKSFALSTDLRIQTWQDVASFLSSFLLLLGACKLKVAYLWFGMRLWVPWFI
jgi:hypothetical protein